jgi:carboxypeptidase family protein
MSLFLRIAFIALLSIAPLAFCQQGTISGMVVDTTGASVEHAQVKLLLDGRAPDQVTQSSHNGNFSFANVLPGRYHLSFTAKGFAFKTVEGDLHPAEALSLPPIALNLDKLTTEVNVTQTQTEMAESQIKAEEKQRLIGIIPNYFVTYEPNAAPLNVKQKAELTWKLFVDPYVFLANGIGAGIDQARNTNKGFGQGAQGYGKRLGASYADFATSVGMDKFVMRAVFKQDPRYFYKGTGSNGSRFAYAVSRSLICQGDNKKAQFCYSSFISRFGTGFLTNYYYPRADRNTNAQILQGGAISLGASAASNLFQEFLARKLTLKKRLPLSRTSAN